MASTIEFIVNIQPHGNADKLELCTVIDWTCVVPKGLYQPGDKVIFIRPDYVLPKEELWCEPYLQYAKTRIRAIKIRGVFSNGIVMKFDSFLEKFPEVFDKVLQEEKVSDFEEGRVLDSWLKLVKYESKGSHSTIPRGPNVKGDLPKDMWSDVLPHNLPKTDEPRFESLRSKDASKCEEKTPVDITLKIDGSSCSFAYLTNEYMKKQGLEPLETKEIEAKRGQVLNGLQFVIMTRNCVVNEHSSSPYALMAKTIRPLIEVYCQQKNVSLRFSGELFGSQIQQGKTGINPHAKEKLGWNLFSVYNIEDDHMCLKGSEHYFLTVAKEMNIPTVPVIGQDVPFSKDLITQYTTIEQLNNSYFEGVVFQHAKGSFKVLNYVYDSKKL